MNFNLTDKNTLLVVLAGSHAYGMATPESDIDIRGICCAPIWIHISKQNGGFDQTEKPDFTHAPAVKSCLERSMKKASGRELVQKDWDELDATIYDVGKAINLMGGCNPNMLELVFTDPSDIIYKNEIGQMLIDKRHLFISLETKKRYMGYALGQLKKIQSHRGWLLNPPEKKPERSDFGLPENDSLLSVQEHNLINEEITKKIRSWGADQLELTPGDRIALNQNMKDFWVSKLNCGEEDLDIALEDLAANSLGLNDEVRAALKAEKRYRTAKKHWKSYLSWKSERNEKRQKLEEEFGYDTKHASHLIRLMRTGCEILSTGTLFVKRADAGDLLAIRRGERDYEDIVEEAENLKQEMQDLFTKNVNSLRIKPSSKALDDLHKDIVRKFIL
jgi:predicted nucleotidyltransferase